VNAQLLLNPVHVLRCGGSPPFHISLDGPLACIPSLNCSIKPPGGKVGRMERVILSGQRGDQRYKWRALAETKMIYDIDFRVALRLGGRLKAR